MKKNIKLGCMALMACSLSTWSTINAAEYTRACTVVKKENNIALQADTINTQMKDEQNKILQMLASNFEHFAQKYAQLKSFDLKTAEDYANFLLENYYTAMTEQGVKTIQSVFTRLLDGVHKISDAQKLLDANMYENLKSEMSLCEAYPMVQRLDNQQVSIDHSSEAIMDTVLKASAFADSFAGYAQTAVDCSFRRLQLENRLSNVLATVFPGYIPGGVTVHPSRLPRRQQEILHVMRICMQNLNASEALTTKADYHLCRANDQKYQQLVGLAHNDKMYKEREEFYNKEIKRCKKEYEKNFANYQQYHGILDYLLDIWNKQDKQLDREKCEALKLPPMEELLVAELYIQPNFIAKAVLVHNDHFYEETINELQMKTSVLHRFTNQLELHRKHILQMFINGSVDTNHLLRLIGACGTLEQRQAIIGSLVNVVTTTKERAISTNENMVWRWHQESAITILNQGFVTPQDVLVASLNTESKQYMQHKESLGIQLMALHAAYKTGLEHSDLTTEEKVVEITRLNDLSGAINGYLCEGRDAMATIASLAFTAKIIIDNHGNSKKQLDAARNGLKDDIKRRLIDGSIHNFMLGNELTDMILRELPAGSVSDNELMRNKAVRLNLNEYLQNDPLLIESLDDYGIDAGNLEASQDRLANALSIC